MREDKDGVITCYIGTNAGQLYATYDLIGAFTKEYIYLDGKQTAMVESLDGDGNGLRDNGEVIAGTDPTNPDTDGDGFSDGDEVIGGTDPLDPLSHPIVSDGDINEDGNVNAGDIVLAQRHVLGLITLTPLQIAHGDVYPATGGGRAVIPGPCHGE